MEKIIKEDLHNKYSSTKIIKIISSRGITRMGYVACIGKNNKCTQKFYRKTRKDVKTLDNGFRWKKKLK
jgi:hypothetical protein